MLMVDLIIILFNLKLDRFYCIGAMNQLKMICYDLLFLFIFNTQELLKKAKDRYRNGGGKENAAEYYFENKEVLRKNAKNKYRNLSIEEKKAKIEYKKKRYRKVTEDEKKAD